MKSRIVGEPILVSGSTWDHPDGKGGYRVINPELRGAGLAFWGLICVVAWIMVTIKRGAQLLNGRARNDTESLRDRRHHIAGTAVELQN